MKKLKPIPDFKNEDQERNFWQTHDSTNYVNWSKATNAVFPRLQPSVQPVNLRMPVWLYSDLKRLANLRDVPYQSLMKIYLAEKVREEERKTVQPALYLARRP